MAIAVNAVKHLQTSSAPAIEIGSVHTSLIFRTGIKDKMQRTTKKMILFRLLQYEELSLVRKVSKKRKRPEVLRRLVEKGVTAKSFGSHVEGLPWNGPWQTGWSFAATHFQNKTGRDFLAVTLFQEHRAYVLSQGQHTSVMHKCITPGYLKSQNKHGKSSESIYFYLKLWRQNHYFT